LERGKNDLRSSHDVECVFLHAGQVRELVQHVLDLDQVGAAPWMADSSARR